MAKANLPVNFKDDILKENMNGKRRFNMIQNSDGTVSFEDVTDYTQVGSTFGAAQINATNKAVNNAADASKIIDSLETIKANTKSGYIAGALAVKELNSNLVKWIKLGTFSEANANIDCRSIPNYTKLTKDNFIVVTTSSGRLTTSADYSSTWSMGQYTVPNYSYNQNTGMLSFTPPKMQLQMDVYAGSTTAYNKTINLRADIYCLL